MKYIISVLSVFFITGCAKTPSDFEQKYHKASKSIVLSPKGKKVDFDYSLIKKVSSSSCDSKTAARVLGDEEEAILVLKLEAAKLEADAL